MHLANQITKAPTPAAEQARVSKFVNEDYLAMMCHEIGTPLSAILGVSHILANMKCSPQKKKECAEVLNDSSTMLRELMSDMIDFAKLGNEGVELEHVAFDLTKVLEEARNITAVKAAAKGLGIHACITKGFPALFMGDPLRIRQIVLNLLGNAVKFTPHGIISLYVTEKMIHGRHSEVRIIVADPGIGIEKEQLAKIFSKYTQAHAGILRKYGGSGLGLFISRELVHLMGGTITVKSQPGKGSQFCVTLPLQKAHALSSAA